MEDRNNGLILSGTPLAVRMALKHLIAKPDKWSYATVFYRVGLEIHITDFAAHQVRRAEEMSIKASD